MKKGAVFVGPMPPERSGVATYDAAVLAGLRRIGFLDEIPIDVAWPVGAQDIPGILSHRLGILQMGNHIEFHLQAYRLAHHMPALVTLHDVALDDFVLQLQAMQDPLGSAAVREAALLRGRMHSADAMENEPLRDPWCAALSRAARGLIVHSEFGRRYLHEFGCRTPVFVVPHPPVEDASAIETARSRAAVLRRPLDAAGIGTVVVAPGDLNRAKCLDKVIRAVARLDPSAHLVLVGRPVVGYDPERAVSSAGMQARVTLARDVEDADFLGWIAAADVVVDLRFPHRGEVSGSLSRAMQAGKPTIVSGTGTYLDLPEGSVMTLAAGEPDEAELASAIGRLAGDAELRSRIGASAAGHVERQILSEATANGYAQAIRSTLALIDDPVGPARQRWARALADLGLTESELALGHGLAYARALDGFRPSVRSGP